jgi:hypothetical protein
VLSFRRVGLFLSHFWVCRVCLSGSLSADSSFLGLINGESTELDAEFDGEYEQYLVVGGDGESASETQRR